MNINSDIVNIKLYIIPRKKLTLIIDAKELTWPFKHHFTNYQLIECYLVIEETNNTDSLEDKKSTILQRKEEWLIFLFYL